MAVRFPRPSLRALKRLSQSAISPPPSLAALKALSPRAVLHRMPTPANLSLPSMPTGVVGRAMREFLLPLLLALVLFAGLVYFMFPTTTWFDQRAEAAEVDAELEALVAEQRQLRESIARMRTDQEIERIARRDFNFVFPGEEAYAILPAPPAPVSMPTSWPFSLLYAEVLD